MSNSSQALKIIRKYFIDYFFVIVLMLATLTIWLFHLNSPLFKLLNSHHTILPDSWWKVMEFIVDVRLYIYPILLLLLAFFLRREKFINVVMLTIITITVFKLLELYCSNSRPYLSLPRGTFYWLGSYGDSDDLVYQAFPSEHIGGLAVFSFAINELFFRDKFWVELVVLLRVILIAIARVFTGWHWPLDVLCTILVSYALVEVCLNISFNKIIAILKGLKINLKRN